MASGRSSERGSRRLRREHEHRLVDGVENDARRRADGRDVSAPCRSHDDLVDVVFADEVDDLLTGVAGTAEGLDVDEVGQLCLCRVECGLPFVLFVGNVDRQDVDGRVCP